MKTFLVFPKTEQQLLWEKIRHEVSSQYVVPDGLSIANLLGALWLLQGDKHEED